VSGISTLTFAAVPRAPAASTVMYMEAAKGVGPPRAVLQQGHMQRVLLAWVGRPPVRATHFRLRTDWPSGTFARAEVAAAGGRGCSGARGMRVAAAQGVGPPRAVLQQGHVQRVLLAWVG
jgi:hypothetical protein